MVATFDTGRHLGSGSHIVDTGMEMARIDNIGGDCILQMVEVAHVVDVGGSHVLQVEVLYCRRRRWWWWSCPPGGHRHRPRWWLCH